MLAYVWFCIMLRVTAPSADMVIARYNHIVEALSAVRGAEDEREPLLLTQVVGWAH